MNEIRPINYQISTGKVQLPYQYPAKETSQKPFSEVLSETIKSKEKPTFSKHCLERISQREIELDESQMDKLGIAVKKAEDKGLKDTLIIMDQLAFIVNVPSNKVITAIKGDELKENVFTNIDGAVLM